ncbi:MAG TPA: asparagine synthase (glutamine-hydrolyzing) [Burkholderiales bacterium]|jgi:asparagine synthase (glutamine-hydrolysing)
MCGIVGIVDPQCPPDAALVRRAAELLARRGPDDRGEWAEGAAAFGHRRLSILDLSAAGHQPMHSADARYAIVFNGEIYNFMELRAELEPHVPGWRSRSDTEVVLAAYARWGVECVKRFHGMFAFAIWDSAERRLFAARDRMGVKPFYYHRDGRRFAFASRPRALFALVPELSREIDEQGLRYYLEIGYFPAPHSIHRSVRKLPPAHWLTFDERGLSVARYWDFRAIEPEPAWNRRSEEDLLDELEGIVSRSVRLRMVSDVPVGVFLSGGIDSSLVAALMRKHANGPVRSFTIGFREPEYDESREAAAVARALGTEHEAEYLGVDDLLSLLPLFREEYDEPFFDSSAFPTMAVSRLARRHVKVSLSGDGGDELFGGYHYYSIMHGLGPVFRAPVWLRSALAVLTGFLPQHKAKLLARALREPDAGAAFAFARSIAKDFPAVLLPDSAGRTKSVKELFAEACATFARGATGAQTAMRLDALYTLPDDYLQKVDVASMAFSLEARDPLLDQELVEWAMRLPLRWKLRFGENKYLLRRLLHRYVPASLVDRPKRGFGVPIDRWLRGPLRAWAQERIRDAGAFAALPISRVEVQRLLALHLSGRRDVHPLLWAILMLLDSTENRPQPSREAGRGAALA